MNSYKGISKLKQEGLIQKDGENYYFLTNQEQDINREIQREDIDYKKIHSYESRFSNR